MTHQPTPLLATTLVLSLACAGCGIFFGDDDAHDPDRGPCEPLEAGTIDPGTTYQYVIDSVDLPTTSAEASMFGANLDGDRQGRPDNALGQILSTIAGALGSDYDAKVRELIADGTILHLVEVRASNLEGAAAVGGRLFLGNDLDEDPDDNFSGDESFAIEPGHPTRPMSGAIINGRLDVSLGVLPLRIGIPGVDEPFTLQLSAARLIADVTAEGLDGRIAGVLSEEQVRDGVLPFLLRSFENSLALDCPDGECVPGSQGELYLELFDADGDGSITLEEVENSSLVSALLAPDVDVFDEDRRLNPRCDGVKESLSLGVGFTAVPAEFSPPAW